MDELMFVYGTLKKGYGNHFIMDGAKYLSEAYIVGWEMRDLGGFPAITKSDGGKVHGEMYIVSPQVLKRADKLEGYPSLFNREKVKSDKGFDAWVYYMEHETKSTVIESGRWLRKNITA